MGTSGDCLQRPGRSTSSLRRQPQTDPRFFAKRFAGLEGALRFAFGKDSTRVAGRDGGVAEPLENRPKSSPKWFDRQGLIQQLLKVMRLVARILQQHSDC